MLSSARAKPFGGSRLPLETIREKGEAVRRQRDGPPDPLVTPPAAPARFPCKSVTTEFTNPTRPLTGRCALTVRVASERRSGALERPALRWLERFIDERLPPLSEVAVAASALAELRHGHRNVGIEALKRLLRRG
jgi:hypothetical protein